MAAGGGGWRSMAGRGGPWETVVVSAEKHVLVSRACPNHQPPVLHSAFDAGGSTIKQLNGRKFDSS